jgi:hypothetical protein
VTTHRIRLRGPWEVRPHGGAPPGRMTIPGRLLDGGWAGFAGRVSFYRRFGRPSNLSPGETVWLVFERVAGAAEMWVNGGRLGALAGAGSFDVTTALAARNELAVIVEADGDGCGIVGDVWLEIRSGEGRQDRGQPGK